MGSVITTVAGIFSVLLVKPLDIAFNLKWLFSYMYVEISKRRSHSRFDLYDVESNHDPHKVAYLSHPKEVAIESPLPEKQLLQCSDEVFFYGINSHDECLIVRIAMSVNNEAEAWIYMKLQNGKIYKLKESSGFQQSCSDPRTFTCGGLQVTHITPMRRWRIFFNGLLWETSKSSEIPEKKVHVKFSFLWRASSDQFDFLSDVNSQALATALTKAKWNTLYPPLQDLKDIMNFYVQSGVIMGTVNIEGYEEDRILYLFGERMRFMGNSSKASGTEFYHIMGQTPRNGRLVHIIEVSVANVVENLRFGFVIQPNGQLNTVTDSAIELENIPETEKEEADVQAKFCVNDKAFELKGTLIGENTPFYSTKGWDGRLTVNCFKFNMNNIQGSGVVIKGKILKPTKRFINKSQDRKKSEKVTPLVIRFSERICQDSYLTGGKGSSLAKLTELSQDFQNFVVPNGIVVTTSAYEMFITAGILKKIKELEDVLYGKIDGDVKSACQRVADEVIQSNIPDQILQDVIENLKKEFPEGRQECKFAVRSSATGEDTEQMSAAGQMDTFLGITGLSEILSAVKKCWASQFGYVAVQYKRQNGQVINSPMAVVIQKMIPCDVAGVLFTCDPLTGNPASLSITANYGLGESVVSGTEEPDTIEIDRHDDDNLIVKNKVIGSKNRRITMKEDEGTAVEEVDESERLSCCLSDNMALRLAAIAIKIEKSYRSHRDIEWGFWNNNLYVFQSRPVTSGMGETDYEIEHGSDTAMRIEKDSFSVCNVGEVFPGATSPLGADAVLKFFNVVFQRKNISTWQVDRRQTYFSQGLITMSQHVMFTTLDFFHNISEGKDLIEATMVAMYGRIIDDEELLQLAMERHGDNKVKSSVMMRITLFQRMFFLGEKRLKQGFKLYSSYRIPIEKYKTSRELFDALMYGCTDLCEAMVCHMICSEGSSIWNIIIFQMLRTCAGEINAEVYREFSRLVTTASEVESADVPKAVEKLAVVISEDLKPEEFKRMKAEEALRWLQTNTTSSGIKYKEFLTNHGHRCLKEFDLFSKTWATEPLPLIQLLQNLVGNVKKDKTDQKVDDSKGATSSLNLSLKSKIILKFILPLSRKAVVNREKSKSLLIKGINAWRQGYYRLAQLMVLEGRLPDKDLLFFMNLDEMDELLNSRSPKIISRAVRRKRLFPTLDKYIYPEIMMGMPVPLNKDTMPVVENDDNFSMKGIPVSQGIRKGFVRVALDLEEASQLQPDEILLTYSTDIGWSPYFPILAGVVTEIGGLISHGAVVSREYGIPCIAGLPGATRQFHTGDYVLLDGNKGILQKLPKPESI